MILALLLLAQVPIVIHTSVGDIEAVLEDKKAPITTSNFLRYVDAHRYHGGQFHRTVKTSPDNQPQSTIKIDVIQGGVNPTYQDQTTWPAIALERTSGTGLKHLDGTISMARFAPDSAVSDFFICIGDQPSLDLGGKRNPDGQGFAAFGRVTKGMDIVKKIQMSPFKDQALNPPVRIISIVRK